MTACPNIAICLHFLVTCHYTCFSEPKRSIGTTELYYISGDRALIPRQSKKCPQKHGGFWPKIRHFDVIIIPIFMVQTTDNQNCSETRRK